MDYLININDFHGPLDLLLHLVKKKEKDIYEISTSVIIQEYLDYIDKMQNLNIDIASEFLVMASSLVHLKSKMLLGITEESNEDEENEFNIRDEEDLKSRIAEYEKYKMMTEVFKDLEEKRSKFYTKGPSSLKEFSEEGIKNDGSVSIDNLINAFLKYQERINYQKPINTRIAKKELSVEDCVTKIKNKLSHNKRISFEELFEEVTKEYLIVNFLAVLQMSKDNEVYIYQSNNFDNIFIEGR